MEIKCKEERILIFLKKGEKTVEKVKVTVSRSVP